jgi:hypothetical protein
MMIALPILHYTFQSGKELNPQPLTMRTPVPKPVTNTCLQQSQSSYLTNLHVSHDNVCLHHALLYSLPKSHILQHFSQKNL